MADAIKAAADALVAANAQLAANPNSDNAKAAVRNAMDALMAAVTAYQPSAGPSGGPSGGRRRKSRRQTRRRRI
jgi:Flp pilus assembly protein TadG